MRLEVVADPGTLPQRAAAIVAAAVRHAVDARGRCTAAFSGGSTPGAMLAALAGHDLPWTRLHVLQVDERVAPDGHPDRNLTLLREQLLDTAPVPPGNVHPMPVTDPDLDAAAARYAATLERVAGSPPALDLVHLGLGADGHTASLVPDDPVLQVRDRDVAPTGAYEGHRRLTCTFPALNRARNILWLIAGADKAAALARLTAGDTAIPAGCIARDRALVLTDTEPAHHRRHSA